MKHEQLTTEQLIARVRLETFCTHVRARAAERLYYKPAGRLQQWVFAHAQPFGNQTKNILGEWVNPDDPDRLLSGALVSDALAYYDEHKKPLPGWKKVRI